MELVNSGALVGERKPGFQHPGLVTQPRKSWASQQQPQNAADSTDLAHFPLSQSGAVFPSNRPRCRGAGEINESVSEKRLGTA